MVCCQLCPEVSCSKELYSCTVGTAFQSSRAPNAGIRAHFFKVSPLFPPLIICTTNYKFAAVPTKRSRLHARPRCVEHLLQNGSSKSTNTNGTGFNDSTLALRNSSSIQNYTQDCITLVKSPWRWRSSSSVSGNVLSLIFFTSYFSFFNLVEMFYAQDAKQFQTFFKLKSELRPNKLGEQNKSRT